MASTPANQRTFAANTSLGLKLTPSNSPYLRTPRSPSKPHGLYESGLTLKRIIGSTVSCPTAFDSLPSSNIFAYTAGAAAVVVSIDEDSKYSQRFYRARPTALPLNATQNASVAPSTPINTANDGRNRGGLASRDLAIPYSPTTPRSTLDWSSDSPSSKTWTSRERIKAATCLSISQDGKFLAVGETGYSPRILIFSLQAPSSDVPLAILNEHTYGLKAVAFSPDQQYLASLGTPNDGFLYVWSINQRTGAAKLHSSNKCTSFIKQMLWIGSSIVTIGTRHIKVWKVDEPRNASPTKQRYALDGTPQPVPAQPKLRTLAGRNCLLGPLVEATFTCLAVIPGNKAIVCSEKGDICLLDCNEGPKLMKLSSIGFPTTCLAIDMDTRRIRIGGRNGRMKSVSLDGLLTPNTPPESPLPLEKSGSAGDLCAMGYTTNALVTIDSKHLIELSATSSLDPDPKSWTTPFIAHGDAVMGVDLSENNEMGADFLTWSAGGMVVFWGLDGSSKGSLHVDIEQMDSTEDGLVNQCQIVRSSRKASFLVTGDKYGILRIISTSNQTCVFRTRAHVSEIKDVALFEGQNSVLVASCGRDRTVQLYHKLSDQWALVQTLDDHSASVCGVIFAQNGERLISCSSDRSIHIRQVARKETSEQEVMGVFPLRNITLKTSPVSMTLCSEDQMGDFVVSLLDRTVATYEIASGRLIHSFRSTDNEGVDAVVLDALVMGARSPIPGRPTILAGVSSTDKSVRVYDGNTGGFLDREWGHTAGVTDVALFDNPSSDEKTLISTGTDGTIMIWTLSPHSPETQDSTEIPSSTHVVSPPKDSTSARQPLRRVLSRAEMAELQRASPVSIPACRSSSPRALRRKTSRYGLSSQSPNFAPPLPSGSLKHLNSSSNDAFTRRESARNRSRSPPSPKTRDSRRPSVPSLDARGRTKSNGHVSEFGTLNMANEQACRTLRAYRNKLLSSESVKEEALRELDQELRLTAIAVGEKSLKSKAISEDLLTGLLDQYSERLVSIFDEKLRLTRAESAESERPKAAGSTIIASDT